MLNKSRRLSSKQLSHHNRWQTPPGYISYIVVPIEIISIAVHEVVSDRSVEDDRYGEIQHRMLFHLSTRPSMCASRLSLQACRIAKIGFLP
jgi:hypothetical protein